MGGLKSVPMTAERCTGIIFTISCFTLPGIETDILDSRGELRRGIVFVRKR